MESLGKSLVVIALCLMSMYCFVGLRRIDLGFMFLFISWYIMWMAHEERKVKKEEDAEENK